MLLWKLQKALGATCLSLRQISCPVTGSRILGDGSTVSNRAKWDTFASVMKAAHSCIKTKQCFMHSMDFVGGEAHLILA